MEKKVDVSIQTERCFMKQKIKVLSVKQPWAWCIFNAGKDIENRSWATTYRGKLYIHASKQFDWGAYSNIMLDYNIPQNLKTFEQGGIVGSVNVDACIKNSVSNWADKNLWNWVLRNQKSTTFRPCKGQLGIFDMEVDWYDS